LILLFISFFLSRGGVFATSSLFPALSSGPGFILPDSPFYNLDRLYQEFKLIGSITTEKKALVRTQIIGERMAELRVMHIRGNNDGVDIALLEISKEARLLSKDLKEASLSGKDITHTAKSINDSLRLHRLALLDAARIVDEETSLKLESVNKALLSAKVDAEEFLATADLESAIQNDLEDELETAVLGVSTKSEKIQAKIEKLQKRANDAVIREAKKAEVEEALEAKKTLSKELKEKSKQEREKKKKLLEERKKKLGEAREAFKKAREAFIKFLESQEAEDALRKNTEETENSVNTQ